MPPRSLLSLRQTLTSVPFEEDERDPSIWFFDHSYAEAMLAMFRKVNGEFLSFAFFRSPTIARRTPLLSSKRLTSLLSLFTPPTRLPLFQPASASSAGTLRAPGSGPTTSPSTPSWASSALDPSSSSARRPVSPLLPLLLPLLRRLTATKMISRTVSRPRLTPLSTTSASPAAAREAREPAKCS